MTRETVGKISTDLMAKGHDSNNVVDVQRELQKDYMANVWQCINTHLTKITGDIYVLVITKQESLLSNVFRNYFEPKRECPTPDWNQSVFKYHRSDGRLQYLWTLPDPDTAIYLAKHAHLLPADERQLLEYVRMDNDGRLLKWCKELNGNKIDAHITIS